MVSAHHESDLLGKKKKKQIKTSEKNYWEVCIKRKKECRRILFLRWKEVIKWIKCSQAWLYSQPCTCIIIVRFIINKIKFSEKLLLFCRNISADLCCSSLKFVRYIQLRPKYNTYIYISMYVCICIYKHIHVYIYIQIRLSFDQTSNMTKIICGVDVLYIDWCIYIYIYI